MTVKLPEWIDPNRTDGDYIDRVEEDVLLLADEFDAKTRLKVSDVLERVFKKVRSISIEEK